MSHFYATIKGNRGKASRCGSKDSGIETYTASWQGAVHVTISHDIKTGDDIAVVRLVPWKGVGIFNTLYYGPIDGLDTEVE
jgi:hypothetical protein